MARRAQRISSTQAAKFKAAAEKSIANQIEKEVSKKLARGIQEFAVRSMNELAKQGPAWTGEFSASWGFAPEGRTPQTPGITGKIYKYTRNDVPVRDVERFIRDGVTRFNIVNTSPHAAIATDQEEAKFKPPSEDSVPIGDVVKFGTGRPSGEHFRWQIEDVADNPGEDVTSQITAEKDWFTNYLKGGGLQKDLSTGFSFGFERAQ